MGGRGDVMALSLKQEAFVSAYVGAANGNAAEAARIAGYRGSAKVLSSMGIENLEKPGIKEAIDRYRAEIKRKGIAAQQNRIDSYVSDFTLTTQIMAERAEDSDIAQGPGGKTGLIVRTIKGLGSGDNFTTVEEFAFDAALLTARQTLRRQIAEELGEWQDNLNLSGDLTTTVRILGGVDPEDI